MFGGAEINNVLKNCNGIRIFDDFTAELGWTPSEGSEFKIAIDGWSFTDFRIDGNVFIGRELLYNEGLWGYTFGCGTAETVTGDTIPIEYPVESNYANENLRCAIYLINGEYGEQTFSYFAVRAYNVQTHAFGNTFPFQYLTLSNTTKMFSIGLPYSTAPGYVQDLPATPENILNRCNTIRGNVPAEFFGIYYNLTNITTNIPIFDTLEHANDYLTDETNETITGILNYVAPDPEEDYKKMFDFWYIKNRTGHNTRVSNNADFTCNLRFYDKSEGIAFVDHQPTESEPWTRTLVHYSNYTAKSAPWGADSDDDFTNIVGFSSHYLNKNIAFGVENYYSVFDWDTNIPLWMSDQDAEDYFNGLKDISEAANFDYISRQDNSIVDPNFTGTDKDNETSLGTNGMQYGYGCRLYAITNIELASLFNELFDPLKLQDILDGQKIFGNDGITESIAGILYIPLSDISDICGLGALSNIKIGNWQSENAQGQRINNNSGLIDCGTFQWTPTYNDFRDFEPYTLAFLETGFWGFHQLQISKYYNKSVNCKVAIDVCTGATSLMLFGDGILLDTFEGTCGASRPFVATDNNAYMNNIISAVTGASNNASGAVGNIGGAVADAGKWSKAAGAAGAVGGAVGVGVAAGGIAAGGIFSAYNIKNAVDSPPQMVRGNLSGNLGYYSNNKISFIIAQKKTVVPENRLSTIGLPSAHGAPVGSFSGFLSCSAFKLADGFTGTDEERAEIMEIMRGGIYL